MNVAMQMAKVSAYFHNDVINAAKKAGIIITSIGYPRSVPQSVSLQTLRRLSEETGGIYKEVNTKKVKPSQRCPDCLRVIKKTLNTRTHLCECGCNMPRDAASGLVMLRSVLGTLHNRLEIQPSD